MGLTCECGDDYDWFYTTPTDYSELATSKRKRCVSCNDLIDIGAVSVQFHSWRKPNHDIEESIYGDEVPMASKYMCESCGDMYFNLEALGFCVNLGDSMKDLMSDYIAVYEPPKLSA